MTATVHTGVHFARRKPRPADRLFWKAKLAWWCAVGIAAFFAINLIYQVIRKPGEIFAPISGSLSKSPASTWASYRGIFEEHSTNIISAEFLAALAQVESDG